MMMMMMITKQTAVTNIIHRQRRLLSIPSKVEMVA